ncbi:PREDICTED: uncharacterized protein LOC104770545 [Camelina sativa]|uniref:Uncharacterized protein LOC104770545 n=1 Tax=Camelina sativa TaxID=90675 RepID=A0ABM1RF87_CAMSA|nr:PREDICTED: uncharacterized protein LOC104770545 [Camelina sativa]
MTRSLCTSCGLRSRHCQCLQQASNTDSDSDSDDASSEGANSDNEETAFKLTPASFCVVYLMYALAFAGLYFILSVPINFFILNPRCYVDVFAESFSVSNPSISNTSADWNVGFTTMSPGSNTCKVYLHTMKSRLIRGGKLISESASPDYFGLLVREKINDVPLPYAVFKTVATPRDGLVLDIRVEVVTSVKIDGGSRYEHGFLILTCGNIPVNFTADPDGNVKGSLLGYMRPCEYKFQQEFPLASF